ncbi:hypothetical protein ZPAH1_orf00379 [Aeromonas phage ZPAH1]|nr:hypothetical protein ASwh1_334 [Aeromonas phage Aswh_1]QQG34141.1 hypothetical protein ZPAH1_orf00379 [Aeromonas phage ZPAH1]
MGNHYVNLNMKKLETLNGKAVYYRSALSCDLESWERKEFQSLLDDVENQIKEIQEITENIINDPWFN